MEIKPWLTAIHRNAISVPMRTLLDKRLLLKKHTVLDYGCGHGFDVLKLQNEGYLINGYDKFLEPFTNKSVLNQTYDIVTCLFVLNTIADIQERINVINTLLNIIKKNGDIFLCVRSIYEFNRIIKYSKPHFYEDGIITSKKTFQKYYSEEELKSFILNNFPNLIIDSIPLNKNTILIHIKKG